MSMYFNSCKYMYIYVCIEVYVCVYSYRCMHVGIRVCIYMQVWVLSLYLCLYVCVGCVLQYFGPVWWDPNPATGDPDPIRICALVDPIHRWFEDRSMRWSIDQYRFVQWRSDGDSIPKPRYFMWVFVLVHFLIYRCRYAFTCYTYHFMWLFIVFYQFDYLWLFTLFT